jgi:hypothetical protein
MTDEEAIVILNNIQLCRDELFDDQMERDGMHEANEIIKRIKLL